MAFNPSLKASCYSLSINVLQWEAVELLGFIRYLGRRLTKEEEAMMTDRSGRSDRGICMDRPRKREASLWRLHEAPGARLVKIYRMNWLRVWILG